MEKLALYSCHSHAIPDKIKKIRFMHPSRTAGNTVGTVRSGSRKGGGKIRGMKAGKQKQKRVNVSSLVAKTKKKG